MTDLLEKLPYTILFRIQHPSIDPKVITETLNMQPHIFWKAGDPRVTPKGNLLDGIRDKSLWSYKKSYTGDKLFFANILPLLETLAPHQKFLHKIVAEGGMLEIYIQIPGEVNRGDSLEPVILKKLHKLNIRLSLEIFPHTHRLNEE